GKPAQLRISRMPEEPAQLDWFLLGLMGCCIHGSAEVKRRCRLLPAMEKVASRIDERPGRGTVRQPEFHPGRRTARKHGVHFGIDQSCRLLGRAECLKLRPRLEAPREKQRRRAVPIWMGLHLEGGTRSYPLQE